MYLIKIKNDKDDTELDDKTGAYVKKIFEDESVTYDEMIKTEKYSFRKGDIRSIKKIFVHDFKTEDVPLSIIKEVSEITKGSIIIFYKLLEDKKILKFEIVNGRKTVTGIYSNTGNDYQNYKRAFDICLDKLQK